MKNSGFNTSTASDQMQGGLAKGTGGKKGRQKERRLMKGFDIGVVKQPPNKSSHKSDVENANKSPRSHWIKLATLANGKKQVKGAKWPYSERSQSVESLGSEVTSEAEATHNESTSSTSSMVSHATTTAGVAITLSDDEESIRCDRATNTDTPALKWSKIRKWSKLGELHLPHRLRMAFQDAVPERDIPPISSNRHHPPTRTHLGDTPRKAKARRTVSAPAPSAHAKHTPLTAESPAATPYASIPSVSVSVQNSTRTLNNTLTEKLVGTEDPASAGSSTLNSPSSPKTPEIRLQKSFRVPTVHIEEEVVVKGTSKKGLYAKNDCSITQKDSDQSLSNTSPENLSATLSLSSPTEILAPNPTESPHKPSNGTLGMISTVYGIEPVNKEMRTGWI